jgi:hypothetical protein
MYRVGQQVERTIDHGNLSAAKAPASILFPTTHGSGLAFTLLLQVSIL